MSIFAKQTRNSLIGTFNFPEKNIILDINPESPRTEKACLELGIDIDRFLSIKTLEHFYDMTIDKEFQILRFQHYQRKLIQDAKDVRAARRNIIKKEMFLKRQKQKQILKTKSSLDLHNTKKDSLIKHSLQYGDISDKSNNKQQQIVNLKNTFKQTMKQFKTQTTESSPSKFYQENFINFYPQKTNNTTTISVNGTQQQKFFSITSRESPNDTIILNELQKYDKVKERLQREIAQAQKNEFKKIEIMKKSQIRQILTEQQKLENKAHLKANQQIKEERFQQKLKDIKQLKQSQEKKLLREKKEMERKYNHKIEQAEQSKLNQKQHHMNKSLESSFLQQRVIHKSQVLSQSNEKYFEELKDKFDQKLRKASEKAKLVKNLRLQEFQLKNENLLQKIESCKNFKQKQQMDIQNQFIENCLQQKQQQQLQEKIYKKIRHQQQKLQDQNLETKKQKLRKIKADQRSKQKAYNQQIEDSEKRLQERQDYEAFERKRQQILQTIKSTDKIEQHQRIKNIQNYKLQNLLEKQKVQKENIDFFKESNEMLKRIRQTLLIESKREKGQQLEGIYDLHIQVENLKNNPKLNAQEKQIGIKKLFDSVFSQDQLQELKKYDKKIYDLKNKKKKKKSTELSSNEDIE